MGPSDRRHRVDEHCGDVENETESRDVQFSGRVVVRERVVVVVMTFTSSPQNDEDILRRVGLLVIRPCAPEMGNTVHRPSKIQADSQSQQTRDEVSIEERLVPKTPGDDSR